MLSTLYVRKRSPFATRRVFRFLEALLIRLLIFFFFNDTATTEIYTLSLHDALPIWTKMPCGVKNNGTINQNIKKRTIKNTTCATRALSAGRVLYCSFLYVLVGCAIVFYTDRKSTRLNSSH